MRRLWALYAKEWARLKRNPAALMAVGLLILMAVLVSIEGKASARAARAAKQPCLVVYDDTAPGWVKLLKENTWKRVPVKFVKHGKNLREHAPDYPAGVNCAVELSLDKRATPPGLVVFRHAGGDLKQVHELSGWVNTMLWGGAVHFYTVPLPEKSPPQSLATFDLGSSKSRAMIGAMLLFSAQFFVCCALFISFTAHERERGILQALALTPASPGEILLSKVLFHLSLSLIASCLMVLALQPWLLLYPMPWLAFIFTSLGLLAVAAVITSFSRSQTSASLIGFCYLMGVGVVFALSRDFPAFAALRGWMFENHAIVYYAAIHDLGGEVTRKMIAAMVGHFFALLGLTAALGILAAWIWKRRGWRMP